MSINKLASTTASWINNSKSAQKLFKKISDNSAKVSVATANTANFVVRFTGTPTTSGQGTTTATLSTTDQLKATMNVAGLTAKGDTATATFTIANDSADLSAALSAVSTCSNTEYFSISHNIADTFNMF